MSRAAAAPPGAWLSTPACWLQQSGAEVMMGVVKMSSRWRPALATEDFIIHRVQRLLISWFAANIEVLAWKVRAHARTNPRANSFA
jgi:hypothetical protein